MAPQLTTTEQNLIDDVVRKDGGTPMDALRAVNQARGRKRKAEVFIDKTTVYRYVNGETHRHGLREKRGRGQLLSKNRQSQEARQSQTDTQPEPAHIRQWGGWGGSPKMLYFQSPGVRQSINKPDPDQ